MTFPTPLTVSLDAWDRHRILERTLLAMDSVPWTTRAELFVTAITRWDEWRDVVAEGEEVTFLPPTSLTPAQREVYVTLRREYVSIEAALDIAQRA